MALGVITGKPGTQAAITATPIEIFYGTRPTSGFIPGPVTIDGNYSGDIGNTNLSYILRAGNLVHRDTTSGKYRTTIVGAIGTAFSAATVTSVTVAAAVATEVARMIAFAGTSVTLGLVGPPTANGTNALTSVTCSAASGTTLTITSAAVPALVAGSFVTTLAATSLTDTAHGPSGPNSIVCDLWGKRVADQLLSRVDVYGSELYAGQGIIDETKLINWPTDTSLQGWIKTGLRANFPGAQFRGDMLNS